MTITQRWWARYALLPAGLARDVLFEAEDEDFTEVTAGVDKPSTGGVTELPGIVLPGFANAHSHAFHRALRGRTHAGGGTFWTWREQMYALAGTLTPATYLPLARAVYSEMVLSGVTSVAEFHYLHHDVGGTPYADPNAMAEALRTAAAEAGLRLTLLDTCYLAGGLDVIGHQPLDEVQLRFSDGDAAGWAERFGALRASHGMRIGAAIHSVRAVPRRALADVAAAADGRPLHVHLSEQPGENEACREYYGSSPTGLLASVRVLGPTVTVVHATHLTPHDVSLIAASGATACFCPTTERDLADGIGPARELADAKVPLSLGSDQNAVIDMFEEARALELDERLASQKRGRFRPTELLTALTAHASIGWPEAGRLAVGARADLVAVRLDTPRTTGARPEQVVFAASAADVDTVIRDGETVVSRGRHRLGDVGVLLRKAIDPLWAPR
jgi:formiminoglutamate deiminase